LYSKRRNLNSSKNINYRGVDNIADTIKTSYLSTAMAAKPATKLRKSTAGSPSTNNFGQKFWLKKLT
jgi:hypothetical protein